MEVSISAKGKKAKHRLAVINKEMENLKERLKEVKDSFIDLKDEGKFREHPSGGLFVMSGIPTRLNFTYGLNFYIDFTIVTTDSPDILQAKIVYGISRGICFASACPKEHAEEESPKEQAEEENLKEDKSQQLSQCGSCERVSRCDGQEDKTLIEFVLNRHGKIETSGKLLDDWWVGKENKDSLSNLLDLHYRALDVIWPEALEWVNERILL